jgi:hypothetical protein
MKNKNIIFTPAIILIIGIPLAIWIGSSLGNGLAEADRKGMESIIKSQEAQHSHLGEVVVIDGDSATVVDINFWCKYVLSNGKELNGSYFDKK